MKTVNFISNRYIKILALLSVVSLIVCSCSDSTSDDELFEFEDGVYYLELDGSPSQMGRKHGLAFKDIIRSSVKEYKESIYNAYGQENGKKLIDWTINKAGFVKDIKHYLPNVYKEIESLANAAELTVEDILLLNMTEEIKQAAPAALSIKPENSVIPTATMLQVQTEDDEKLCAQNMDYSESAFAGKQLVIRYKYPNREILIYTFVGRVGGVGVNDKGLSVLAAKLPQGHIRQSDGLGVNFLLRMLLELDDVDKAVQTLKNTRKFASYSYAIADYSQSIITEESGDQFVSSPMLQHPGFQCHTNHMLWIEPKDRLDIPGVFENSVPLSGAKSFYTIERLEQAKAALSGDRDDVEDDSLQDLLVTSKVNYQHGRQKTLQSVIIEYDEDDLDMIVSAGSDTERDWNRYDF